MSATGTTTVDFGTAPGGNYATSVVTGQTAITSTSYIEAWIMAETSADHTLEEHLIVPMQIKCGNIVNATGFTIYAFSDMRLTGTFTIRWVWN